MPQRKTPAEVAAAARAFAIVHKVVWYKGKLYRPVDFRTLEVQPASDDVTIWVRVEDEDLVIIANDWYDILFDSDAQIRSWKLYIRQYARRHPEQVDYLLVRVGDTHVMRLDSEGQLQPATGEFMPNFLNVPYDPHNEKIGWLFDTICDWMGGKEQAESFLYHVSTALQPAWSAKKYILLIGDGRNGKGTLLTLTSDLIGAHNISDISRLDMANKSSTLVALNGALMNMVMDGPAEFLKDNSTEKTLVVGERTGVRLLWESMNTTVQTTALFIEGLNTEPRVADKSPALQKRLVRFKFNNHYKDDSKFEELMRTPQIVAAYLALLLKYWVRHEDMAEKLQITGESLDLQVEAVKMNNPILRFLEETHETDDKFLETILAGKMRTDIFLPAFSLWLERNGYKNIEKLFLDAQMKEHFLISRKTFTISPGKTGQRARIEKVYPDALNVINALLRGETLAEVLEGD